MKNNTNITYRRVGNFKIPNIILPPEEATVALGKWGMLHKDYLIKHKKVLFATLLAEGKLWQYLADIDIQAQQMFNTLVEQMKETERITEHLKGDNQVKWIVRMNNIHNSATEIVTQELIYT